MSCRAATSAAHGDDGGGGDANGDGASGDDGASREPTPFAAYRPESHSRPTSGVKPALTICVNHSGRPRFDRGLRWGEGAERGTWGRGLPAPRRAGVWGASQSGEL